MEKFDFKKNKDREEFEKLSKEEQSKINNETQEETSKCNENFFTYDKQELGKNEQNRLADLSELPPNNPQNVAKNIVHYIEKAIHNNPEIISLEGSFQYTGRESIDIASLCYANEQKIKHLVEEMLSGSGRGVAIVFDILKEKHDAIFFSARSGLNWAFMTKGFLKEITRMGKESGIKIDPPFLATIRHKIRVLADDVKDYTSLKTTLESFQGLTDNEKDEKFVFTYDALESTKKTLKHILEKHLVKKESNTISIYIFDESPNTGQTTDIMEILITHAFNNLQTQDKYKNLKLDFKYSKYDSNSDFGAAVGTYPTWQYKKIDSTRYSKITSPNYNNQRAEFIMHKIFIKISEEIGGLIAHHWVNPVAKEKVFDRIKNYIKK